jgi:prevent-host-death family protein
MHETKVGIRELKARLSEYIRQVKAGRTVIITERGRAVARLVPADYPVEDRLQAMLDAGLAEWSGNRLPPVKPPAKVKRGHSVADMLVEDRR